MTKQEQLDELKIRMEADKNLPLRHGATQLVFGVGNPETNILCIGEGPGFWEDQRGEPFVGNAGKLLDPLLQSIKLPREMVFITNVVHHRPPGNRDPLPEEISAYGKYLDRMIEIIQPKVIVTLGRFSMAKFLPNARISSVHGRKFKVNWEGRDVIVVPMFHPAAALRNGEVLNQIKNDFLKLPGYLEELETEQNEIKSEQTQLF
jgi:DNA polymerase